jgi:hypothetical protein
LHQRRSTATGPLTRPFTSPLSRPLSRFAPALGGTQTPQSRSSTRGRSTVSLHQMHTPACFSSSCSLGSL